MRRFSLYRRGRFYYCQFYNQKTGKYLSGRSTKQESRNAATLVVYDWLRNGIPEPGSGVQRSASRSFNAGNRIFMHCFDNNDGVIQKESSFSGLYQFLQL
jgi:hypothetical protein